MENEKLRKKSLDEMIDNHIDVIGTDERDAFEEELRLDILGQYQKDSKRKILNTSTTWRISWS